MAEPYAAKCYSRIPLAQSHSPRPPGEATVGGGGRAGFTGGRAPVPDGPSMAGPSGTLWLQLCLSSQCQALEKYMDAMQSQSATHKQVLSSLAELEDKLTESSLEVLETDYLTDDLVWASVCPAPHAEMRAATPSFPQHTVAKSPPSTQPKIEPQWAGGHAEAISERADTNLGRNPVPQESAPLCQETRGELRCRVQRPSVPQEPAAQGPEAVLTSFQAMMEQMLKRWQDALSWVQKQLSACAQKVALALTAICNVFERFCCSVAGVLQLSLQV
ncbi:PREDICTED: interleukin-32 [Propithecus coquereli]|uniref:interleukin-32 n=1 Tax=Propithecus coquereli TaxID=379532 RepID=UPI00063F00CF|nr:PREDICTED: interleukin-32 [Propithecus coquereli]